MCIESNTERDLLIEKEAKSEILDVEIDQPDDPVYGFFFLGFVANLAFNYLMQEAKFFGDVFGQSFGSQAATFYALSTFAGQLVMLFFGSFFSFNLRFTVSSLVLGAGVIAIPLLTFWRWPLRLGLVFGTIVVMGLMTAVINSSGFSFTSLCSPRVRMFFTLGTCLAGVTGWISIQIVWAILTKFLKMKNERDDPNVPIRTELITCIIVLGSATVFFVLAVVYYLGFLSKTPAAQRAFARAEKSKLTEEATETGENEISKSDSLKAAAPLALALISVMFATFILTPDQIVKWTQTSSFEISKNPNFYAETMMFAFNLCDVIGRMASAFFLPALTETQVFVGSFARWLLVPMFFCATYKFWFFENDFVRLGLQILFGLSYGILVTWSFVLAPSQQGVNPKYAGTVGALMSCVAVFGILLGAVSSGQVAKILDDCFNFRPYDFLSVNETFNMVAVGAEPLFPAFDVSGT